MFQTNPINPCELQYRSTAGEAWQTIFTAAGCCDCGQEIPANYSRECNLAAFLTEVLLPDGTTKILAVRDSVGIGGGLLNGLGGVLAGPFSPFPVSFLAFSAVALVATALIANDTNTFRSQLTNAYWAKLKQELFQVIPEDGRLTQDALLRLAWAVQYVYVSAPGDSDFANLLVTRILRAINPEVASRASIIGAEYQSSGCIERVQTACELIPVQGSPLTSRGPNQYRVALTELGIHFYQLRTIGCCQLHIDAVWADNQPINVTPLGLNALIFETGFEDDGEIVEELLQMGNRSFAMFAINWQMPTSYQSIMVDFTIIDCGQADSPRLFFLDGLNRLTPVRADANGDYSLLHWLPFPAPDVDSFRRYYLRDSSECASLELAPFNQGTPVIYGLFPPRLRIWECGTNTMTEYDAANGPDDLAAIEAFKTGARCFNSFAVPSPYNFRVRLSECAAGNPISVAFAVGSGNALESQVNYTAQVVLSISNGVALPAPLTVPISVVPDNLTAEVEDYFLQTPTITFPIGSIDGATQQVVLTINADTDLDNESITLRLGNPTSGALGAITEHTVTIEDVLLGCTAPNPGPGVSTYSGPGGNWSVEVGTPSGNTVQYVPAAASEDQIRVVFCANSDFTVQRVSMENRFWIGQNGIGSPMRYGVRFFGANNLQVHEIVFWNAGTHQYDWWPDGRDTDLTGIRKVVFYGHSVNGGYDWAFRNLKVVIS